MNKKVNPVRNIYLHTFSKNNHQKDVVGKVSNGIKYIIGVDEAGRGPLAGPVAVAVVAARVNDFKNKLPHKKCFFECDINYLCEQFLMPPISSKFFLCGGERILFGIKDSKKLSPKKREEWRKIIIKNFFYEVSLVNANIIDKIGIVKAVNTALVRNLKKLRKKINFNFSECFILLDGALKAPVKYAQKTIIKGDEKIPLISAASVIAKTERDKKMVKLHKKLPFYSFDLNKGYGTKAHIKAIKNFGFSQYHRVSFCQKTVLK